MVSYVKNASELLANDSQSLRRVAVGIAEQAIAAADPGRVLRKMIEVDDEQLRIGDYRHTIASDTRIFIIGAGKASYPIAKVLDEILGPQIFRGLVTCKEGQPGKLKNIELHHASHPIPSAASQVAALRTQAILSDVQSNDIIIACFTGGSSALFVDPVEPISVEEKAQVNRILLSCGANIVEINAVRKHLSRVKGGRLIRNLPPGVRLINLTVSDVIGDPLDYITDPSVPDSSTFFDAQTTLEKYGLWKDVPASVVKLLMQASPEHETVRATNLAHIQRTDILLVGHDTACHAAAEAARSAGFTPLILSTSFEGESRELGRFMAAAAKQAAKDGHPIRPPCALIGGGESTVEFTSCAGQGGPNQEFAAAFALEIAGLDNIVSLSIDTDGTDGPTDIAGGLVDGCTAVRAHRMGLDLYRHLRTHDVTPALQRLGAAVFTGPTGTNVNDLRLVLVAQQSIVDNLE